MLDKTKLQFLETVRFALENKPYDNPDIDWAGVASLARRHNVEQLFYHVIKHRNDVPEKVLNYMKNKHNYGLMMDIRQSCVTEQISALLTQNGIEHALLKGIVLKNDYPESYMRAMTDVDFYIRSEMRPKVEKLMPTIGGSNPTYDRGDVAFDFPGNVHVEFHGRYLYKSTPKGVVPYTDDFFFDEKNNRITEEGFAVNLIGHMARHLSNSGIGVRFIIDLWVYMHRHAPSPHWDKVRERLVRDGIDRVADNLIALAEHWFSDGEGSELLDELGEYIFDNSLYGDPERSAITHVSHSGSRFSAFMNQLFRPKDEYFNRYPWLNKYPFLLPVAWFIRIFQSAKNNTYVIKTWGNQLKNATDEQINEQRAKLERFGLINK